MNTSIISKIKNKKGFSLMEVMVSVFVLSIGITAVIALMAGNIRNSINARDSIIASELAQEGVELVRNIRDNNFINNPATPFSGLAGGTARRIDYNNVISSSTAYQLYYNSGFYTYTTSGSTATKFSRKINIVNYVDANTGRKITSTVWWDGNASAPTPCNMATRCIYAEDVLTDWAN